MLESIQYTPDGYFYHCRAIDIYTKLVNYNILQQGLIDNDAIKECSIYLMNEKYTSGPIFPLILLAAKLLNLGYFFNFLHITICGILYYFLLKQFLSLIKINNKNKIIFGILISPIFLWLLIFPSTDIISSIFILISLNCILKIFKEYNLKDPNLINKRYLIKLNVIFFISILFNLLCRPIIFIIFPILIIFYFITWAFTQKNKQHRILLTQFVYSKNFYYLLFSFVLFSLISHQIYSIYEAKAFPENVFQLHGFLFETYSPPAPPGLKEFTHKSFSRFFSLVINNMSQEKFGFLEIFKQFLYLILSITQSLIFSLLSLSGFQISIFNNDNISIFRYLFSTYKIFFALLLNLPGIFIIFLYGSFSFYQLLNKPINFLTKEENLFNILTILSMFYCIILLFTIGHIRYLLPIYPILIISSYDFWERMIFSFKKSSFLYKKCNKD